jgi:hypothetical protein
MSGGPTAAWPRKAALALAGAVLAWRIAASGLGEFYAERGEAAAALAWQPGNPKALREQAARLESRDPAQAEALLARAWRGEPSDGRALIRLAELWRKQGQNDRADRACALAERLLPADAPLHMQAARYWLAAGNPRKTVQNWSLAMQINPEQAPALYPALLGLAGDPAGPALLAPAAAAAPAWWPAFFAYAADNAASLDTLRTLYALRKTAGRTPSPAETRTYLARLMREGLWAEAYIAWINALRPDQQPALGYLFDGGFELAEFQGGFDWSAATQSVQVGANHTLGAVGRKALRVAFKGKAAPPSLVEQTVFLLPGRYRLTGMARPDALQAGAGLEWALDCAAQGGARLAASERFVGSDIWHKFAVDFKVPNDACAGVRLRLQAAPGPAAGLESKGEIWFDELAIELAEGEPAKPPAGAAPYQSPGTNRKGQRSR